MRSFLLITTLIMDWKLNDFSFSSIARLSCVHSWNHPELQCVWEPSETLLRSIFMLRFFLVLLLHPSFHNNKRGLQQQRGRRSYKFFFTTPNVDRGKTIQRPIAAFSYVSFNSDFFLHISFHQVSSTSLNIALTHTQQSFSLSLSCSSI